MIKIYSDASIKRKGEDYDLYIGFVIEKINDEKVKNLCKESYNNINTTPHSTQGEFLALLHALRYYKKEFDFNENLKIFTDSDSMKKLIERKSYTQNEEIKQYLNIINEILKDYDYRIYYIDRKFNKADKIL